MAIPSYNQMFRPILTLATSGPITRQSVTDAMGDHFHLSEDERNATLPSGAKRIRHRVGWAMTGLTKSGLIAKVSPNTYRATEQGIAFLGAHPDSISDKDLATLPVFREWLKTFKGKVGGEKVPDHTPDHIPEKTPLEAVDEAVLSL
jgi:restriction system protein